MDVKFSDVAGLGKIRFELEEVVKFFTHAEMYRRRERKYLITTDDLLQAALIEGRGMLDKKECQIFHEQPARLGSTWLNFGGNT